MTIGYPTGSATFTSTGTEAVSSRSGTGKGSFGSGRNAILMVPLLLYGAKMDDGSQTIRYVRPRPVLGTEVNTLRYEPLDRLVMERKVSSIYTYIYHKANKPNSYYPTPFTFPYRAL